MKLIISVLIIISVAATSCSFNAIKGSEELIEKELDFNDFENIEVEDFFTLNIVRSEEYKIKLECNENVEEYIVVEKDGSNLKLSLKGNHSFVNVTCIATIYMPNLNELESAGATTVNFVDFTTENLDVELSGASKIYGNITVNNLKIETAGASYIDLTGDIVNGVISTAGVANMNGDDLIFQNLTIDCSGASKIVAHVTNELDVEISGTGKFEYYGDPKIINQEISGIGKIAHL